MKAAERDKRSAALPFVTPLHRQAVPIQRRQPDVAAQPVVPLEEGWRLAFPAAFRPLLRACREGCGMRQAGRAGTRHMADDGQYQLIETRHDLLLSGSADAKPVADGWQLWRRVLSPATKRR